MAERDNDRMRLALIMSVVLGGVSLVVACTGGPGTFDQGSDNGDQYDAILPDQGGNSVQSTASSGTSVTVNSSTSSTSSSGITVTTSTSSSGTPVKTYSPQPDIKATDYNQSCTQDYECYAIHEGAVCTPCAYSGCSNAAIANGDIGKFSTDRTTRYSNCDPKLITGTASCGACNTTGQQAYCDSTTSKCAYGVKPDAGTSGG